MILLSTGSLHSYGLGRAFELAAETGFDGVEVIVDARPDTWQPDYLKRLSREYGLPIRALHSPFLLGIPDWPAAEGKRAERTLQLAEEIGAGLVVVHLPVRWRYSIHLTERRRYLIPHPWRRNHRDPTWFEQTLPFLQAETAVTIAVEIMPMQRILIWPINAYRWNTLDEWSSRFDHLTLDTTHCGTWRVDPLAAYQRAKGRLSHVHLSNFDGREHRLPQQGKLRLDRLLRQLAADGYAGDVAVETGPEAMEAEDESRARANLAASLAFCRQHLAAASDQ